MNYEEEEEDESVWASKKMDLDLSDPSKESEEEEEPPVSPRPGARPTPAAPGGALPPSPTGTVPPPPPAAKKLGECCKRMTNELAQETNVLKWKDHKENPIIVFAHNLNKILHCPWCGETIPAL
jgi:hypothetical protein